MTEKLSVCFNSPQSGWMSLELKTDGQKFVEAVSYTPYDSIRDLINTLATLLVAKTDEAVVKWAINPESFDFVFSAIGGAAKLNVVRYRDHHRVRGEGDEVFSFSGTVVELCRAFWKALRDLESRAEVDEYARNWRREFPGSGMREFTKVIKSRD